MIKHTSFSLLAVVLFIVAPLTASAAIATAHAVDLTAVWFGIIRPHLLINTPSIA